MQTITITSKKDRRYTALIDGRAVGILNYPKWYSEDAEITVGNMVYALKGKGFWKTSTELLKDGQPVFIIRITWSGTEISHVKQPHHYYKVISRGWHKSGYMLESHKGEKVLEIEKEGNWKKWTSGYTVTVNTPVADDESLLLAFLAVHCYRGALIAAATGVAAN